MLDRTCVLISEVVFRRMLRLRFGCSEELKVGLSSVSALPNDVGVFVTELDTLCSIILDNSVDILSCCSMSIKHSPPPGVSNRT